MRKQGDIAAPLSTYPTVTERAWLGEIPKRNAQGPSGPVVETSRGRSVAPTALLGVTVLIVDDDPIALETLAELLLAAGATVLTAAAVGEAVALVRQRRPRIIVSDLAMPERDGHQLIKIVRTLPASEGGTTPAIALSGLTSNQDRVRALLSGYQVYLTKPTQAQHLIATIASLIERTSS